LETPCENKARDKDEKPVGPVMKKENKKVRFRKRSPATLASDT